MVAHGISLLASSSCGQGSAVALAMLSDSLSLDGQKKRELLSYTKKMGNFSFLVATACTSVMSFVLIGQK